MITRPEKMKRGKSGSKVSVVKYLPRAHQLALLDDQGLAIYTKELDKIQDVVLKDKQKILVFCLNMGVYRPPISGQLQSQTD